MKINLSFFKGKRTKCCKRMHSVFSFKSLPGRLQLIFFSVVFLSLVMFFWLPSNVQQPFLPSLLMSDSLRDEETLAELQARHYNISVPPSGYSVWNEVCKIPRIDPFTDDANKIYKPLRPYNCSQGSCELITKIYDDQQKQYRLRVNSEHEAYFVGEKDAIVCCYEEIMRLNSSDNHIRLGKCQQFIEEVIVPRHIQFGVMVKCNSSLFNEIVFKDVFHFVQVNPDIQERLRRFIRSGRHNLTMSQDSTDLSASDLPYRFGVQLVGIDSLSQINFRRTMPRTFRHLLRNDWFELSGYNKIDDNTFQNWMALLAGIDDDLIQERCNPMKLGGLNACPMLFKLFSEHGCSTAFCEDEVMLATFNYGKRGLQKPLTDYYLRPAIIAAEFLLQSWGPPRSKFCLGIRSAPEYVYGSALEFARRYAGSCSFGLFWTNSFSHENFRYPSMMDKDMLEFFKSLESNGVLANNVIVFFSDHGSRFGDIRKLPQGFMDERLPILFIWLPLRLRLQYPQFELALRLNKHRLTTPYDVHATLKHLLAVTMGWNNETLFSPAPSCAQSQTLLKPVPEDRSCSQACIPNYYCTCIPYKVIPVTKQLEEMSEFVIKKINRFLQSYNVANLCSELKLKRVRGAFSRVDNGQSFDAEIGALKGGLIYRTWFEVTPADVNFEAIVFYDSHRYTFDLGDVMKNVSRLDLYALTSKCMKTSTLKKFCVCKDYKTH